MAISNELSGDIAAALLAAKDRSPLELNELKKIVFEIHSTLQKMTRGRGKPLVDEPHGSAAKAKTASTSNSINR